MAVEHKYHDVKFFLIAIAFISAFNYYLTYSNIRFNWFLVLTYTIDTVQGWLAWWVVRTIIIYLDRKLPYTDRPLKRILIQVLVTTGAGLLIIILLTEMVSLIARGRTVPISFYLFDIFIILIWFLVINGIYIGMHYYAEWKRSEMQRLEEKKVRAEGFSVKHGRQNLMISFGDILGFYSEEGYTVMLTWENKKYFPDRSLDKIEETLPEEWFFRLNRQYIVHRKALTGFKRTGDGKIDVLVNAVENFPKAIQVSRTRAVPFKNWFQPTAKEE
ncbi:MAG: LytTR family transcriptional regulator DNA-binding domain-containing protein [Chitinophagaceae bacterium]|nr:LytTR family transcriptional regulator DNA-binding domain-containing protein [Chitinophagaceae bacterium]